MGRWLNNSLVLFFLSVLTMVPVQAQIGTEPPVYKDYKDPEQFDKFSKRRKLIATWQVNELKKGALVVKLKTNKMIIDALVKAGNDDLADKKKLEALAINLNISRAYRYYYSFSKIYFIYSHSSDSLLNGVRKNIFLDTNLAVDPTIEMTEKFYLLAETDDIYNSSIGFVPEDSARFVKEQGSKTTQASIVIKNKYGHQLKGPFPYKYYLTPLAKPVFSENIIINKQKLILNVTGPLFKSKEISTYNGKKVKLEIPEDFTYFRMSFFVFSLNDNLHELYRLNPRPSAGQLEIVKPYLY